MPRQRTIPITVHQFASAAESDRHDLQYWQQMPSAERVLHVWRRSLEIWRLRGEPHEPGLCRTVARVHRR